jgi:hypothetical protein
MDRVGLFEPTTSATTTAGYESLYHLFGDAIVHLILGLRFLLWTCLANYFVINKSSNAGSNHFSN